MEALLAGLAATDLATAVRGSRWLYAAVNGGHILGIALLVGGIAPLDLRLLGCWPSVDRTVLARVLTPMAAAGLTLAVLTGLLLFACRAPDYADLTVFQAKLGLITVGASAALLLHVRYGRALERAPAGRLRRAAALSLICWTGALGLGRLIAFVGP